MKRILQIRPLVFLTATALCGCSGTTADPAPVDRPDTRLVETSGDTGGEYQSPDSFSVSQYPAKCGPPKEPKEEVPGPTVNGARALALQLPSQVSLLARGGADGLELLDVSDAAYPQLVSLGVVRGSISQLLPSSAGQLWVAASEPPALSPTTLPTAEELNEQMRVIRLDVSAPAAPVRVAETPLQGDFWHFEDRDGALWVLSARRVPEERGCAAAINPCGPPRYEALELHGFRLDGNQLEPIASAELPLGHGVWWATDGVATLTEDGVLHALTWAGDGRLRPRIDLPLPGDAPKNGPLEIAGNELTWVGYGDGHDTLYRFDLAATAPAPARFFDLGAHPAAPGAFSLFFDGKLWLNHSDQQADAQLWDVSGAVPERIPLPGDFTKVLPVSGAVLDAQPGATALLGWQLETAKGEPFFLLGLDTDGARIIGDAGAPGLIGSGLPAPRGLRGIGAAPAWRVEMRGPGLPLSVAPSAPRDEDDPPATPVLAFVGIPSRPGPDSPVRAEAALVETDAHSAAPQTGPRLEIRFDGGSSSFEVPPSSRELIAVPNGVLVLSATDQCSAPDCSDHAPAVTLFDTTEEPRRVAAMPMPEPQLEVPWDASRMSVRWTTFSHPLTGVQNGALPLDEQHVAFRAEVSLSCFSQVDCDALGIEAVPVTPSLGLLFPARCPPPDDAPDCVEPPTPTLIGRSTRQYFFALQLRGGTLSWRALGISTPGSSASSFGGASIFGTTLAAARLEHFAQVLPTGYVPTGQSRFMLERFRLDASGEPELLPPVNVPGYPAAYLGADGGAEYWLTAEPLSGATGRARLHRLRITAAGAESQLQLDLGGPFVGLWTLQVGEESFGLSLSPPENACGATRLTAVRLGADSSSVALEPTSFLDLPSDQWAVVALDAPRVLLRRGPQHVMIELDTAGRLSLVRLKSSDDVTSHGQLIGTTLRGDGAHGELKLEF